MRKELKIIGSRERHVFTATFIRFGFRDGYKGPVKTILLQDVLLDDKIVTDHLWFDLTKGFERRLLRHTLANVILSIISVATIIALFTLIQN